MEAWWKPSRSHGTSRQAVRKADRLPQPIPILVSVPGYHFCIPFSALANLPAVYLDLADVLDRACLLEPSPDGYACLMYATCRFVLLLVRGMPLITSCIRCRAAWKDGFNLNSSFYFCFDTAVGFHVSAARPSGQGSSNVRARHSYTPYSGLLGWHGGTADVPSTEL